MTKKEEQRIRRLELENDELKKQVEKHMRVYADTLMEVVILKAKLELVMEAVAPEWLEK